MGKYTNEKSLVVFQENFFTKIKNFFKKTIFNRNEVMQDYEDEENFEKNVETNEQEPVKKKRTLFNYDAEDNDNWSGDGNMENVEENNINEANNENERETEDNLAVTEKEEVSEAFKEKQELEQKLMNYYASIKGSISTNE